MNLLNYHNVNLHDVFKATKEEADKLGVEVTGSEIVGLVPKESLVLAGKFYSEKENNTVTDEEEFVAIAIEKLGLSQLYPFNPEEKVIDYMVEEDGPLASLTIKNFLSELASSSPAPGGGSVAALAGALGTGLSSMVCNLTIGKEKYADVQDEMKDVLKKSEDVRRKLTELIDKDTNAFNDVIKAFRMPKETEEQKEKRSKTIQEGYKTAAKVPLQTAKTCEKILDISMIVAEKGNKNSITDAAVSAIMAQAGVHSAILNVKINLSSIKDKDFIEKTILEIEEIERSAIDKTDFILKFVDNEI